MNVELVRVQTADGIRLDGALRRAEPGASRLPVDVVILHHGVGGNFYSENFFDPVGDELLARGCAALRVNNRGHDLAYNTPSGRLGAAFETVDDSRHDWKAWIDFAEQAGYRRVALWGHSLGAVKTIYFSAVQGDPRVACAIATSPPRFSYSDYLSRADGSQFRAYYDRARRALDENDPDGLLTITIPTSAILSARTYVDKYGPDERYDLLKLLPGVSVPILVTIGSEEGARPDSPDRFSFGGLAGKVATLAGQTPNLTFELISGADHMYTGKTDDLWSVVERWLATVAGAEQSAVGAVGRPAAG